MNFEMISNHQFEHHIWMSSEAASGKDRLAAFEETNETSACG